jgi:RNA ligase (TIGR02306 family)
MSDWKPQVVKIEKIEKHPNATALDIATVMGDYPVIIKSNQYKVGQLVGYIPIDSIVPDTEEFYFLCPKQYEQYEDNGEIKSRQIGMKYTVGSVPEKYRILKAKQFLGFYSQGMLVNCPDGLNENDSIVDSIGLKKWEEEEEDNIPNAKKARGGNMDSPPKNWAIPYYDIDSLRKYIGYLLPDEEIVLTEKLHGCNSAFCHDGDKLWVKSRNFYKKMDPDDPWWDIAIRYDLEKTLSRFPNMVFFGELYGSVKNYRYDCEIISGKMNSKIRFFDIWDVKLQRYLDYDPFITVIEEAQLLAVPQLYRGLWLGKETMYPYAEGLTTLGGKHSREGFVLRTVKGRYEPKLNSRMQVKLVGEGYNLKK